MQARIFSVCVADLPGRSCLRLLGIKEKRQGTWIRTPDSPEVVLVWLTHGLGHSVSCLASWSRALPL
jgi:hypothetical protein